MAAEYRDTAAFRGASFTHADLTGATFRECDMSRVRIVASQVVDLTISGHDGRIDNVVVNDVDVTDGFQPTGERTMTGVISDLELGANEVTAQIAQGRPQDTLTLTNHPIEGLGVGGFVDKTGDDYISDFDVFMQHFDANNDDQFNFYVYWYRMRSGRCNDGSTTPGCPGDQGSTYHYGNVFEPPDQPPFPRDRWFCIEIYAKANGVGSSDGALSFWIDDVLVGDYGPGYPEGTWLRDRFHTGGCDFSACSSPAPFEGFDFRTHAEVRFKQLFLDAYYERDTTASRRANMEARGLTVNR
jgi:hypothetical protein